MVEIEQSVEAFGFAKGPFAAARWLVRERDDIFQSLSGSAFCSSQELHAQFKLKIIHPVAR